MPERGAPGGPRGSRGGVRPGIQQYGNVRGFKRTPLEKLSDKRAAEKAAKKEPKYPGQTRRKVGPPSLPERKIDKKAPMTRDFDTERKSTSARKAAGRKAASKKANETTTGRAAIPEERTVRPDAVDNPFPKQGGKKFKPNRAARVNPRASAKGVGAVAAAAAGVTAGSAILGGSTDRTGSKKDGLDRIKGGRYRSQASDIGRTRDTGGKAGHSAPKTHADTLDRPATGGRYRPAAAAAAGKGHDRPARPLPSTRSTLPVAARSEPAPPHDNMAALGRRTVTKPSVGMYSVERPSGKDKYTPEQIRFAKGQLQKGGYQGAGDPAHIVKSFKALNRGAAQRRSAAGMGRATSVGSYSALAAGDPGKGETQAQKTARRSRVPRLMGR